MNVGFEDVLGMIAMIETLVAKTNRANDFDGDALILNDEDIIDVEFRELEGGDQNGL